MFLLFSAQPIYGMYRSSPAAPMSYYGPRVAPPVVVGGTNGFPVMTRLQQQQQQQYAALDSQYPGVGGAGGVAGGLAAVNGRLNGVGEFSPHAEYMVGILFSDDACRAFFIICGN